MEETFHNKYDEFCVDLLGACPELKTSIDTAKSIDKNDRMVQYQKLVLKQRKTNPRVVLPNVEIPVSIFKSLSRNTIKAIEEYNSILDLCVIYTTGDIDGISQEYVEEIMKEFKSKMEGIDFNEMSSKFFNLFGAKGDKLPPLPEKFLKGHIAKLAEDLVKEFNPEDFGFTPEDIEECEKNPAKAFEILMKVSTKNPNVIQNALKKIGKKLQAKIQSGAIKPQDLAKEAEELIQEFQNNPAFVDILEGFKGAFDMDGMDFARKSGNDGSARLNAARERLRRKLDAKKKGNSVEKNK
jgi:GTPase SAR1 family protein